MRDDDRLDDENHAPAPTSRTDDTPSSGPVASEPYGTAGLMGRLGDVASRSRSRFDELRAASRARIDELSQPERMSRIKELSGRRSVRLTVATGVVCCLGLAAVVETGNVTADAATKVDPVAAQAELLQRAQAGQAASRSQDRARAAFPPAAVAPDPAKAAAPAPSNPSNPDTPAATAEPAKPTPVDPGPIAGLDEAQMDNAKAIVRTGRDMGISRQALIVAVATALQESNLYNLASGVLPESMNYPNQGVGWDHDSVGLFQQRSSSGWGPVDKLMDPAYATARFLDALMQVPGWDQMPLTLAAQAVQGSAFPWAYAQHEDRATVIVDAILAGPK
jgi:hypothetical protein